MNSMESYSIYNRQKFNQYTDGGEVLNFGNIYLAPRNSPHFMEYVRLFLDEEGYVTIRDDNNAVPDTEWIPKFKYPVPYGSRHTVKSIEWE